MKSYYPNMIREQPSMLVSIQDSKLYPVVRANMKKSTVTIEWVKTKHKSPMKQSKGSERKKSLKTQSKKRKFKFKCCCFS